MLTEESDTGTRSQRPPLGREPAQTVGRRGDETSELLDAHAIEAIALNLDASLKVHSYHHFFSWTQGLLQNLIKHELLICALCRGEPPLFHVDSFSVAPADPALFSNLFRLDTTLVPHLVKEWESHYFQPVVSDIGVENLLASSPLARELNRLGASRLIAQGTHDTSGKLASFFVFACRPEDVSAGQAHLVELMVPIIYTAWMRTKVDRPMETAVTGSLPSGRDLLTLREQEILKWLYLGKSNIEIGMILGISPLTVKNHVRKILRRLNVQNRTQAVGKALALRILTSL